MTLWRLSYRADPEALPIADRHYNRQKPGTPQFVPPGRCLVLKWGDPVTAVWVTSWPYPEYVKHAWPGAWMNSMFRKESKGIASDMIRQAVSCTRHIWPVVPDLGMVSFIDPLHVKPVMTRGRPTWARSYFQAGFLHVGYTKGGLWVMQMLPEAMPEAEHPSTPLFGENE